MSTLSLSCSFRYFERERLKRIPRSEERARSTSGKRDGVTLSAALRSRRASRHAQTTAMLHRVHPSMPIMVTEPALLRFRRATDAVALCASVDDKLLSVLCPDRFHHPSL